MACIDCGPAPDLSKLPRSTWHTHPHFPDQLLLVGSHEGFRGASARCIELARLAEPPRQDIASQFRRWHRAMASHEAYEEGKLYPYLAHRYRASFAHLARDHEDLHGLRDAVLLAFDSEGDTLRFALERYDVALRAHLDREELAVIPLLLDLSPEEFRRYYNATSAEELLQSIPACTPH